MMDAKHIEPLKKLIKAISTDADNFQLQLTAIMDHLFLYYQQPEVHVNPCAFMEEKKGKKFYSEDFPAKLKTIVQENTDTTFLEICPFSSLIVELSDMLQDGSIAHHQARVLAINLQLQQMVHNVEKVQPLLEMRELLNALLGVQVNVDINPNHKNDLIQACQNKNLAFALLGTTIQKYVSTKEFDSDTNKFINWRMLRYLADKELNVVDKTAIETMISNAKQDFINIREFIDQLILIESTKYTENRQNPVMQYIVLTTLEHDGYIYTDEVYIELALEYLNSIDSMRADNQANRFAILRIITALGEIAKNISQDLKTKDPQLFDTLKDLRDSIVHENQAPSISEAIRNMLHEVADTRLRKFMLTDLTQIRKFFNQLQQGLAPTATSLSAAFVESLTKDYKLTGQERADLLATLPTDDTRKVSYQRINIENILRGNALLPNTCNEFALLLNGLGLSNRKMKDLFVKLKQIEKVHAIQDLIISGGTDVEIKKVLQSLQSKDVSLHSFIDSTETLNRNNLSAFLVDHITKMRISDDEITAIIDKIPLNVLDISADKAQLKAIIEQKTQMPEHSKLNTLLDKCLITGDVKDLWIKAFSIINGQEESSYVKNKPTYSTEQHINSLTSIENILSAIKILSDLTTELRTNPSDKERFYAFLQNKPLIFACEYLYNLYIDNLNRLLWQVEQYNLCGILKHEDFQYELEEYKTQRNDIFHLNFLYLRPQENLEVRHEYFYDSIMHIIEGMLFLDAITVSGTSINVGPIHSVSLRDKFITVQIIIANTAKSYFEQELVKNQHLDENDPVIINIKNNLEYVKKFIPIVPTYFITDIKYDNDVTSYIEFNKEKSTLLKQAKSVLNKEQFESLKSLFNDESFSEQILEASREQGIEKILEVLFNINIDSPAKDLQAVPEQSMQETIEKIEAIIGKDALNQLEWFYKYSHHASSTANNFLSNSARGFFKTIEVLVDILQECIDLSAVYKSISLNSLVTANLLQLEQIFEYMGTATHMVIIPPRYPDFDPDYDSGGSGGSRDNNQDNPNIHDQNNILFLGNFGNSTTHE